MKNSILFIASVLIISSAGIVSCSTPAEKVEDAQNNVIEANKDLEKANENYLEEVEAYRKETNDKIEANNKSIAEYRIVIETQNMETRATNKRKLAELERKNSDLRTKINEYKADGKDRWEIFKKEFNHDMEGLGDAFKDISVKNTK